jgi:serpin B
MTGRRMLVRMLPLLALACAGTSTGNPTGPDAYPAAGGSTDGTNVNPVEIKVLNSGALHESAPALDASSAARFGSDNRAFAFDLYRQISRADENLFFSPYGISVGLAKTYAGAAGATKSEMRAALHFSLPEPDLHRALNATTQALEGRQRELATGANGDGFTLNLLDQAWGQTGYPFLDGYLDVLAVNYGAGLLTVDFANSEPVRQTINRWVRQETGDRIKDLLPSGSITSETRLVLTNAVYFKASWLQRFDPTKTGSGTFRAAGADRTVSVMQQTLEALYAAGSNYQALSLGYLSKALSMILILPAEGAFAAVAGDLSDTFFQDLRGALSLYTVTVALPRFQFESTRQLKQPLSTLGMPTAFGPSADFSVLGPFDDPLSISEVHHRAWVTLDEQGTEATASTAAVNSTDSVKPSAAITLDRPFLFLIYDEPSGQILFLGQLADPG